MLIWLRFHKSWSSFIAKIRMILSFPVQDAKIRWQLVKHLPACDWLILVLGKRQQTKEQPAFWAYSLVACTCMKAPGETPEQELGERYALIAKDMINTSQTGKCWRMCCLHRDVPQRWLISRRPAPVNRRTAVGYNTFHRMYLFLLPQKEDGLQSYDTSNKKMKATQQQCSLIFMKHEVNQMQKQNITP